MMGSEQKRALLAVVLSGIILFGWQYLFAPPVPTAQNNDVKVTQVTKADENTATNTEKPVEDKAIESSEFELKNEVAIYKFNSQLVQLDANNINSKLSFKEVFKEEFSIIEFDFGDGYKAQNFEVNLQNPQLVTLTNSLVQGSVRLNKDGRLNFSFSSPKAFRYRFKLKQKEEELTGGMLKQFIMLSDDLETVDVGSDDKGEMTAQWFGIDFNYHLYAIVPSSKQSIKYNVTEEGTFTIRRLEQVNNIQFDTIFIKKEYDVLSKLGDNLHLSVDFGIFSILSTPILRGLQYFYSLIPNYGIAIIILTLIMRLLTFPLQWKSYKSMKKMQDVQPELTKLKEKYKDDPQRMQQETMALFKRAGANPLGGCLPMLLQMPIFFAFYRVLYNAVELVDAPFYFWITDLSAKDPYYVLPVLMGLSMFLHQKLTPTATMDPTQKKIMLFMPLIFALFMKDFPAGLTLYIVVSTIAGMAQQLIVYRKS